MGKIKKVALGVGAGDAIGAAFARRFAAGGYSVAIARRDGLKSEALVEDIRNSGGSAHAFSIDARDEASVVNLFSSIEKELGPIEVCLFNAGANFRSPLTETSSELFEKV